MATRCKENAPGPVTESAYQALMGLPVILQVVAADLRIPLRGTILAETPTALRFRIGMGWDIDIFKSMVLAVEEDYWVNVT
jgi:hypothetical protein